MLRIGFVNIWKDSEQPFDRKKTWNGLRNKSYFELLQTTLAGEAKSSVILSNIFHEKCEVFEVCRASWKSGIQPVMKMQRKIWQRFAKLC